MGGFGPNQAAAPAWSNYKVPKTDTQSYFDSHTFLNGAFLYKYICIYFDFPKRNTNMVVD